ncbi:hypothetical protein, partial [Klebsiella pneumoniae]|uniref:hypothetical protein n=1 Tax=Klebsiella pneumoniae TaxID=573 RepID=UPI00190F1750
KEAFCDALGDFATAAEHEEASKVEVDLMEPVTELERLTAAITVAIEAQTKGYFELGKLLIEAKEQFDKASDFLQWADDTFSFKKAYVYRVM